MGSCLSTGCGMSTILACLLLGFRCNVARLQASFAFFPPNPPSYFYEEAAEGIGSIVFVERDLQISADELLKDCPSIRCFARRLTTSAGKSICINHFEHNSASITLLWSHGNAEDLGHVFFSCVQLAERLGVNIVAYDYEGYGGSSGKPLERTLCNDILCVYEYLLAAGLKPSQIVLYGQSVGSGPSVWLASKRAVHGLILHSPLASGLRSLIPEHEDNCASAKGFCSPLVVFSSCDMFPNFKRISRVRCPTLFMHGTLDEVLDISHTMALHKACPPEFRREPFIVQGAGHDNLAEHDPRGYINTLTHFLSTLGEKGNSQLRTGERAVDPLQPVGQSS